MTSQKQRKLFLAKQAFERQISYVRRELAAGTRSVHLHPVLDFLEYLVRDMADIAGVTNEVTSYAKELASMHALVITRKHPAPQRAPQRAKGPPKLRLVK